MNALRAGLAALLLCFASIASAQVAVPQLTGRVVDRTDTLSADQVASLSETLRAFEARKGAQIAVLMVPTTSPETIEQFSLRVAEAWKIGRRKIDDGALLVVAKDDRALRIEVGYGLEGALNDVTAKRIIDDVIVPKFRAGDFAGGVTDGVERMLKVIDGEPLPPPKPERTDAFEGVDPFNPFILFAIFVGGQFMRLLFGRFYGSLAAGGVVGIVAYLLVGTVLIAGIAGLVAFVVTLIGDSVASGGSGGSRGGWSGGSSSGSGGFSGGGGSFGGGGASGKW